MKTKILVIALSIILSSAAYAAETKPSEASIKELLAVTQSQKMIDMSKGQVAGMASGPIQQALAGKQLTPDIKKIVEEYNLKVGSLLNDAMKWDQIEPTFVQVYQENLTQDEVNGIVSFYKTPAGKAMIEKMPALMQASGQKMQAQMAPVMQKIQQLQQETNAKLQAELAK